MLRITNDVLYVKMHNKLVVYSCLGSNIVSND